MDLHEEICEKQKLFNFCEYYNFLKWPPHELLKQKYRIHAESHVFFKKKNLSFSDERLIDQKIINL